MRRQCREQRAESREQRAVHKSTSRRISLQAWDESSVTRADLVASPVVLDERSLGVELAGDPGGWQGAAVRHLDGPPRQLVQWQKTPSQPLFCLANRLIKSYNQVVRDLVTSYCAVNGRLSPSNISATMDRLLTPVKKRIH